jgi:hypothetical protein
MKNPEFPKLITTILLCILGAIAGAFVMLFHAEEIPESSQFVHTLGFYVWLLPLIVSTAIMAVSIPVLFKSLTELKSYFKGNKIEFLVVSLIMIGLCILPFLLIKMPGRIRVLAYHSPKMMVLMGLGFIVALLAMIGIWLVNAALRVDFKEVLTDYRKVTRFLYLGNLLKRFLTILGLLISLLVLSNGALRYALISAKIIWSNDMPTAGILANGAYYTLLVALAYVPTYLLFETIGRRICDGFFPLSAITSETIDTWHQRRKSLEELLNIRAGIRQNLLSGIAILSPLLSSLISILLPD